MLHRLWSHWRKLPWWCLRKVPQLCLSLHPWEQDFWRRCNRPPMILWWWRRWSLLCTRISRKGIYSFYKTFMIMREKRFIVMWINFISRYMGLKDELSLASALDPRFKALPFLSDDEREEIFAHLITITEALATEKSSVSTNEHWIKMQTVCTEYLCCVVLWNVVRSVTIKL